jgi:hypothetical protein
MIQQNFQQNFIATSMKFFFFDVFSSPRQRQWELLASVVCCRLTFHILIFSSETPQPNELKLGRKNL